MTFQKGFKLIALLSIFTLFTLPASAHNLWIETSSMGEVGQAQKVYVYLGEYSYGVREDVSEHLEMLGGGITLWLIKPGGEVVELDTKIGKNRFVASFTPEKEGHYQLALSVTNAPVVDWRQWNLGILKTNYFGTATVRVGSPAGTELPLNAVASTNELVVQPVEATSFEREMPIQFQLTFNGEPLAEQEVKVGYKGQWFKTLYTNKQGQVTLSLPWDGQYVVEAVYTEKTPGTFQGKDYEAIRHTATFYIPSK